MQSLAQKLKKAKQQRQFCQDMKQDAAVCYKQQVCKKQQNTQQCQKNVQTDKSIQIQTQNIGCKTSVRLHNKCLENRKQMDPLLITMKHAQKTKKQSTGGFFF